MRKTAIDPGIAERVRRADARDRTRKVSYRLRQGVVSDFEEACAAQDLKAVRVLEALMEDFATMYSAAKRPISPSV